MEKIIKSSQEEEISKIKRSPVLLKLYKFFKKSQFFSKYILNNLIFKPPNPITYEFIPTLSKKSSNITKYCFNLKSNKKNFDKNKYFIDIGIEEHAYILSTNDKSTNEFSEIPLLFYVNCINKSKILIIYSHGNASDLGSVSFFAQNIAVLYKVNVITYDYRGFGISKYNLNEKSIYSDLEFVLSFAVFKLNFNIQDIVLMGYSIGSSPTVEIGSRFQNLGGIILLAPIASLFILLDFHNNVQKDFDEKDIFCNISKIENVKSNIFILHGKLDEIINYNHSVMLFSKYTTSNKLNTQIWMIICKKSGHNDLSDLIEDPKSDIFQKLTKFISLIKHEQILIELEGKEIFLKKKLLKENFLEKEISSLKLTYNNLFINRNNNKNENNLLFVTTNTVEFYENLQKINDKELG